MKIAVIAWGSLIWCPGNLRIKTRWRSDGPVLPIEFARISSDDRVTLVIHPASADQPTYWALSHFTELTGALDNLRARERAKITAIHHVDATGHAAPGAPHEIVAIIAYWLAQRSSLDAAVWTGLASNWRERRDRDFTPEDAVRFLTQLEINRDRDQATYGRAREYVTNAPSQVDTAVRRLMRERGWIDSPLPEILFEMPRAMDR